MSFYSSVVVNGPSVTYKSNLIKYQPMAAGRCNLAITELVKLYSTPSNYRGNVDRPFISRAVGEDRNILEARAKNYAIENAPDDASEEVTKIIDVKWVKSTQRGARVDESLVVNGLASFC